jgi:hypothetical protein
MGEGKLQGEFEVKFNFVLTVVNMMKRTLLDNLLHHGYQHSTNTLVTKSAVRRIGQDPKQTMCAGFETIQVRDKTEDSRLKQHG